MTTTTREQRTLTGPDDCTLLTVWLTSTSACALDTIRARQEVSATDAVNQALQAYAMLLEGPR